MTYLGVSQKYDTFSTHVWVFCISSRIITYHHVSQCIIMYHIVAQRLIMIAHTGDPFSTLAILITCIIMYQSHIAVYPSLIWMLSCIITYHHVSSRIIMYHYVSSCIIMYQHVPKIVARWHYEVEQIMCNDSARVTGIYASSGMIGRYDTLILADTVYRYTMILCDTAKILYYKIRELTFSWLRPFVSCPRIITVSIIRSCGIHVRTSTNVSGRLVMVSYSYLYKYHIVSTGIVTRCRFQQYLNMILRDTNFLIRSRAQFQESSKLVSDCLRYQWYM